MRISGKTQIPIGFVSDRNLLYKILLEFNEREVNFRVYETSTKPPFLIESELYNSKQWNKRGNYKTNRK